MRNGRSDQLYVARLKLVVEQGYSDVTGFRSFNNCTGERVLNQLEAGNLRLR